MTSCGSIVQLTPESFDDMVANTRRLNAKFPAPTHHTAYPPHKPLSGLQWPTASPSKSDGGPTDYYRLPSHADELRHLISYRGMSKSRGDIFKACWRIGMKDGNTVEYDLNKMKFFIEDLIEMHKRGELI